MINDKNLSTSIEAHAMLKKVYKLSGEKENTKKEEISSILKVVFTNHNKYDKSELSATQALQLFLYKIFLHKKQIKGIDEKEFFKAVKDKVHQLLNKNGHKILKEMTKMIYYTEDKLFNSIIKLAKQDKRGELEKLLQKVYPSPGEKEKIDTILDIVNTNKDTHKLDNNTTISTMELVLRFLNDTSQNEQTKKRLLDKMVAEKISPSTANSPKFSRRNSIKRP